MIDLRKHVGWVIACFLAAPPAIADDAELLNSVTDGLLQIQSFEMGANPNAIVNLERQIFQLPADSPIRGEVEQAVAAALSTAKSIEAKRFLCEQLRIVATEQSIPALAGLLSDPNVSHMARRALARMDSEKASAALRNALATTRGATKAGVINSLADRRDSSAVEAIAKLIRDRDPVVARAAIRALGRIGGTQSLFHLIRAARSDENQQQVDDALLQCAEMFAKAGDIGDAETLFKKFYFTADLLQFRIAGLRGLAVYSETEQKRLVQAIRTHDLRRDAIALVSIAREGEQITREVAELLPSLPDDDKVILLRALAERGDVAAQSSVSKLLAADSEEVRIAAIEAAGRLGGSASVVPLLRAMSRGENSAKVARAAIKQLSGDDIDAKISQMVDDDDSALAVVAIEAVGARRISSAMPKLIKAAGSTDDELRMAAIAALGDVATDDHLSDVLNLIVNRTDRDQTLAAARRAIGRLDKSFATEKVLEAMQSKDTDTVAALIPLLSAVGTADALAKTRELARDDSTAIQNAVVVVLSEWPSVDALDDLAAIIKGSDNPQHRKQALAGYVRLASDVQDGPQRFAGLVGQLDHVDEKKMVLAALGQSNAESPEALDTAMSFIGNGPLQATAGLAALRIANRLRRADEARARKALEKVVADVDHDDVRRRALEVINEISKHDDHITTWVGVGPYTLQGSSTGRDVYQTAFGPEKGETDLQWKPITKGISDWQVNLESTYGGLDFVAAYLRTRVWSPTKRAARLEMGSDDGIRAWVNGDKVWDEWREGGVTARQYRADVSLAQGWNDIMVKVVDNAGGWAFCLRVREPDGTAIDGLKIEAK